MTSKLRTHFKHFAVGALVVALGASAYVIAAVTFSDFAGGTTISASEMNAKLNALKAAVNTNITRLEYNGTLTDSTVTPTYESFRTVGTFNKVAADTAIELTWNSHLTMVGTVVCDFQVRINDTAAGSTGLSGPSGRAVLQTSAAPVSVTQYFAGLPAGSHTVSIWVRGVSATSCTENSGNYTRTVFVKEVMVSSGSTTLSTSSTPFAAESVGIVNDVAQ